MGFEALDVASMIAAPAAIRCLVKILNKISL